MITGIVEIACLSVFSTVQSSYVTISLNRLAEITVLVELTTAFCVLIFAGTGIAHGISALVGGVSSIVSSIFVTFLVLLGWFQLLAWEKAPFDLVEAESELIDGVTTEFDGYAFSLVYAGEVTFSLVTGKMFADISGYLSVIPIIAVVLLSFTGRIFLARFLMTDLVEFAVSVGIVLSLVCLVIVVLAEKFHGHSQPFYFLVNLVFRFRLTLICAFRHSAPESSVRPACRNMSAVFVLAL